MTREQRNWHAMIWCAVACVLVIVILSALAARSSEPAADRANAGAMGGTP